MRFVRTAMMMRIETYVNFKTMSPQALEGGMYETGNVFNRRTARQS